MRYLRLCGLLLLLLPLTACFTTSEQSIPKAAGLGIFFKVVTEQGDTVNALSRRFAIPATKIRAINRLRAKASALPPGMEIIIPVSTVALKSKRVRSRYPIYSVESGDDPIEVPFFDRDGIAWPLDGIVTWSYGERNGRPHQGIDITTAEGSPIKSVRRGVVAHAGWSSGYGWTVIVDHDGFKTLYAHCKTLKVKKGQVVREGSLLGLVGRSGNASGYHLHFEYRSTIGRPMDPLPRLASYSAR